MCRWRPPSGFGLFAPSISRPKLDGASRARAAADPEVCAVSRYSVYVGYLTCKTPVNDVFCTVASEENYPEFHKKLSVLIVLQARLVIRSLGSGWQLPRACAGHFVHGVLRAYFGTNETVASSRPQHHLLQTPPVTAYTTQKHCKWTF